MEHPTLTPSDVFARACKASQGTSIDAIGAAVAVIRSTNGPWDKSAKRQLMIHAVAACLGTSIDEAGSRLFKGNPVAERAAGAARKLISFADRVASCAPGFTADWTSSPEANTRMLRDLGHTTSWSVERALALAKPKKDKEPTLYGLALIKLLNKAPVGEQEDAFLQLQQYMLGEPVRVAGKDTTLQRKVAAPVEQPSNVISAPAAAA